jgi:hypothetical protein
MAPNQPTNQANFEMDFPALGGHSRQDRKHFFNFFLQLQNLINLNFISPWAKIK